jgi:hypothetical protein
VFVFYLYFIELRVKFVVPIAITMMITELLDVASCGLVETYQGFLGMCFSHAYSIFTVLSRRGM